jgi:hypothetical protein
LAELKATLYSSSHQGHKILIPTPAVRKNQKPPFPLYLLFCAYIINKQSEMYLIAAHQYHVRVESSPSPVPVTSYGKIQLTLVGDSDINETFTLTQ